MFETCAFREKPAAWHIVEPIQTLSYHQLCRAKNLLEEACLNLVTNISIPLLSSSCWLSIVAVDAATAVLQLYWQNGLIRHHDDLVLQRTRCLRLQGDNKGFLVCKKKMVTSAELLCRYTPPAFRQVTNVQLCLLLQSSLT